MCRLLTMVLLFLTSFLATGQIPALTQQHTIDSLYKLLPDAQGKSKIDVLNHLSLNLAPRSFDSSFSYAGQALKLSEELDYTWGKGIAIFNLGNSYYFKPDIKNALTNYLAALRLLEPFEPARETSDLLYQLGAINQYVRNSEKMLAYYHRAARNYKTIGDTSTSMFVNLTIGASYFYMLQTLEQLDSLTDNDVIIMMDSATRYTTIVLDYYLVSHTRYKWYSAEIWLTNIYNYLGIYNLKIENNSLGLKYYLKALETSGMIEDSTARNFLEGLMCSNLSGVYYFILGNPDEAFEYAGRAIRLLKKINRDDIYSWALLLLGEMEMDLGHFDNSGKYFSLALSSSDTFLVKVGKVDEPDPAFRLWAVTQIRSTRVKIYSDLVKLHELTGDYKNALAFQKKLEIEKSIQSLDELKREIIGLEAENEDEMRRQEIALLARDNELHRLKLNRNRIVFASTGGVFLIFLLLIMFWIQRKRFRSEHKAIVLEQKLLRAQMNPHFIFNSLYSIQNFIVTEKPDKASIYLSKFAKLVRNILDNSLEEFVPLEKEISTIENYLELQKVRYAGKFDYRIDIADEIDPESIKIPPMLAQPFIENAIEHGIKHRETQGHIDIRFSLKENTLIFEVEDDGVGRQKAREIEIVQDPDHRSMATSLTHERLTNLNRKLNKKIILEIIDLKNDLGEAAGTKVVFGVPVRE